MTSLGAALVILEEDDFESCLKSLTGFDQIGVLTDSPRIRDVLTRRGYDARVVMRPQCIEQIGEQLLSVTATEWLLLLDPDERLVCADLMSLRLLLGSSAPDVAGYWLDYRLSIFGHSLDKTYADLSKSKFVRRDRVRWPASIHELPIPREASQIFGRCPDVLAHIDSDLMADPLTRLRRHLQWATLEAAQGEAAPVGSGEIRETLWNTVNEYFLDRACPEDGTAGELAGLLHLSKSITSLLLKASVRGVDDSKSEASRALALAMAQFARSLATPSEI